MKKILLAFDGSDKSKKAAQKTSELVTSNVTEVTILTVLKDIDSSTFYNTYSPMQSTLSTETMQEMIELKRKKAKETGREVIEEAADFFTEKGIDIEKYIRFGSPADIICEFAEKHNFDLIVLADKGTGGVKRFLLGSTSDKVVRHARTSVLVVK